VFLYESENAGGFGKIKDFSRSQAVTYTVNMVITSETVQDGVVVRPLTGSDIWPME